MATFSFDIISGSSNGRSMKLLCLYLFQILAGSVPHRGRYMLYVICFCMRFDSSGLDQMSFHGLILHNSNSRWPTSPLATRWKEDLISQTQTCCFFGLFFVFFTFRSGAPSREAPGERRITH